MIGSLPVTIHATTACVPVVLHSEAAELIAQGIEQQPWGLLSTDHVQVCPQHAGVLTERVLDEMQHTLPNTRLRLHATVPVMRQHYVGERAWWSPDSAPYWQRVAELSKHIRAPAFTFHAGTRAGHRLEDVFDEARRFEQLFECVVGVEGLYPDASERQAWFVNSWSEYRALMESGIPYALDLSHLNILMTVGQHLDMLLVQDMVANPKCIEIHVSDNDGVADRHQQMRPDTVNTVWWMPLLDHAARHNPQAVWFSESSRAWAPRSKRPTSARTESPLPSGLDGPVVRGKALDA